MRHRKPVISIIISIGSIFGSYNISLESRRRGEQNFIPAKFSFPSAREIIVNDDASYSVLTIVSLSTTIATNPIIFTIQLRDTTPFGETNPLWWKRILREQGRFCRGRNVHSIPGSIREMFRALDPFTRWAFGAGDNKKPIGHGESMQLCIRLYGRLTESESRSWRSRERKWDFPSKR
jgi:hypothetical protein